MTIDKEQLILLLTEKTGLETDQVEAQLTEFINRIHQAAEEGKTFEIEGFGIFSMDEGNLQFKPNDMLETEINNKYAGMKPIELIGAFKEPEGDEVPDMGEQTGDEDARWIFDEAATEEKTEEKPLRTADVSEEETDAEEVYKQIFGEKEEAEPVASIGESAQRTSPPNDDKQSKKDPIGRLLVAAVVVIALGVGGWVTYDMGFSGNDEASGQQYSTSSQTPARQAGDSRPEPSQDSPSPKQEDNASELEEQKEVVNGEESRQKDGEQQTFGLRGEFNQAAGGYTIVVHSLRSVRKAENNQQDLREAGFRTLVSKAEVRGTTYYRVGIGQFETISDAQQALNEIPARYKDDNFIKRIR